MEEIRFISAHGALGAGVDAASLAEALCVGPAFIACDAGTTDAGPFYLGSGQSAFPAEAVRSDLAKIIDAARVAGCPAIVGSVGTAGTDQQVAATLALIEGIAEDRGETLRVAAIYTEVNPAYLVETLGQGRIDALDPAPAISPESIWRSQHIVAMIGVEPLQEALAHEVDVVVAGRCSDAALFAALPIAGVPRGPRLARGEDPRVRSHGHGQPRPWRHGRHHRPQRCDDPGDRTGRGRYPGQHRRPQPL
ncbi:MAG: acyclic terpene utilization AtuA family protein [Acidimicrobiales bacterium]|jgi:hypothetical protein